MSFFLFGCCIWNERRLYLNDTKEVAVSFSEKIKPFNLLFVAGLVFDELFELRR